MEPISLHRNDDNPSLYFRVWDQDNEQYLDMTATEYMVFAKFREKGTTTLLSSIVCTKVSPSMGLVRMDWPAGTLDDLTAGRYEIEVQVCASATSGTITGVTAASPAVVTSATHGLTTGDEIHITSVVGMTELNDRVYTVTVLTASTFSLDSEDSSAYTAYGSAGTWRKLSGIQTANRYYMCGTPEDDANTIQIRLRDDF
jgi:hypothetical protein